MAKLTLAVPVANGQGAAQTFNGGWATVSYRVTSGTGTTVLQVSYDSGVSWDTAPDHSDADVSFTAQGIKQIALAGPCLMRASVSGSSSLVAAMDVVFGVAATQPRVRE